MPKFGKFDAEKAKKAEEEGGLSSATLQQQKRAANHFCEFMKNLGHDVSRDSPLWRSTEDLQSGLVQFFQTYRTLKGELPKRSTLEQTKSFIKTLIKSMSNGDLDISDSAKFPKFCNFWKSHGNEMKKAGKV